MRRLIAIPGILFGLMFAGGGVFFLAQMALPMWQDWQEMRDWTPASARLESVGGSDNETRVQYRYQVDGSTYRGNRVGVSEVKDNIGSYHPDMQAYLRRIERGGDALPIWVDPADRGRSVIDRDMRWGLLTLMVGFCSIFILIGLAVVYGSLRGSQRIEARRGPSLWEMRKRWLAERDAATTDLEFVEFCRQRYAEPVAPAAGGAADVDWHSRKGWEDARIHSDALRGVALFWGFAIIWNAVSFPVLSVVPEEVRGGNQLALIALVFPLIGLFLAGLALKRTLEFRRFGRVWLHLDPYPGAIGGHVGGVIEVNKLDYRQAAEAGSLTVELECVYSYVSGSGKNRSRRESIKWAERGKPGIGRASRGVNLSFRFDVPEGLPQADVEQSGSYYFWRLRINADLPGTDLERSYNIPVFASGRTSRGVSHDISAQVESARKRKADATALAIASGNFDIDGLSRALRLHQTGNLIELRFPMLRNRALTAFAAIFAGGFGFGSYAMAETVMQGGIFGVLVAVFMIPFVLVALVATIATIYLPLNNLRVRIQNGEVDVLRRLLLVPVYRRRIKRGAIARLEIKRSGSTGQGVDKVEHFKIHAHLRQGGRVTLAEDIDGEDVALHFRDYLARRIGV